MRKKYTISLLVIAILLAFTMTVGTSYSFWSITETQTNSNEVTTGCLKIELNDLDVDGNSTNINLTNAYPVTDDKGLTTEPYTLTIKNVCSINAKYTILLNTLSDSSLTESNIKYHLVKTSPIETTMTPALINSINPIGLEGGIIDEIQANVGGTIKKSYILSDGVLDAQSENVTNSVTYNLRMWIDKDAGIETMGNTFESAIAVYAEAAN